MMTNIHVTGFRELYFYKCQCVTHLKDSQRLEILVNFTNVFFRPAKVIFFSIVSMETFDQEYITPHTHIFAQQIKALILECANGKEFNDIIRVFVTNDV